jgi:enamine deaminase RidA (YjgF/YER057c/UK114 family)
LHHEGILAKIDALLAAAGSDKSKLISAQIWVKDISQHFKPMNKVWCAWLDPNSKPVRATVEANLALPDLLVEIQVTAAA